MEVLHL